MEKRQYKRKSIDVPVVYESPAMPYRGRGRNLSAGGILIDTGYPVAPGVEVSVSFDLSGRSVHAGGKVIRLGYDSLCVEFLPHEKTALADLVNRLE